ncbi:DMT family transporter [Gellertiella hungarica]|uniref:Drug/metabolite transporter (DMT)-like permease n=1 Tax=Gellertiella hungarica TaxID=1572859 RepID=A0A7W6J7R7_9HYPH|nr:DMT family transporter [Gellertiella hungarica]MBB4065507.1 drug/metabolite transporter (DMT)-like permease [Gellertiella hungarica]
MPLLSPHRKGLLITFIGGLALSFDVPLVRLSGGSAWQVIALRSIMTFAAALALYAALRLFTRQKPLLVPGRGALVAGIFYGISTIFFLGAVFHTSTANVVFIIAFNPMFAALASWIFLKERPSSATLLTMAVMIVGVGVIVQGSLEGGHLFGDMLAMGAALLLAGAITIGRATRQEMGFVPLIGAIMPAAIAAVFAWPTGFSLPDPFWLALDGMVMIPLAFFCLATGPRYLKAAEVGMFYLLETVLAPIWVWLIFSEVPTTQSLVGGLIITLALVAYSAAQMRRRGDA